MHPEKNPLTEIEHCGTNFYLLCKHLSFVDDKKIVGECIISKIINKGIKHSLEHNLKNKQHVLFDQIQRPLRMTQPDTRNLSYMLRTVDHDNKIVFKKRETVCIN